MDPTEWTYNKACTGIRRINELTVVNTKSLSVDGLKRSWLRHNFQKLSRKHRVCPGLWIAATNQVINLANINRSSYRRRLGGLPPVLVASSRSKHVYLCKVAVQKPGLHFEVASELYRPESAPVTLFSRITFPHSVTAHEVLTSLQQCPSCTAS